MYINTHASFTLVLLWLDTCIILMCIFPTHQWLFKYPLIYQLKKYLSEKTLWSSRGCIFSLTSQIKLAECFN